MKRLFPAIILIIFPLFFAKAGVINVPQDYTEIQTAIDNAGPGDTIYVAGGIYNEYLTVEKRLFIFGAGPDVVDIVGNDSGCVVTIDADSVVFSGFAVTGSGNLHEEYMGWDAAILIKDASYCVLEYCYLHDNLSTGIIIAHSQYCRISHCTSEGNAYGMAMTIPDPYTFPEFSDAPNIGNQIIQNRIIGNDWTGIIFDHGMEHHSGNTVCYNLIMGNSYGMGMIMHANNQFQFNCLMNNSNYGSSGWLCMGGGGDNSYNQNVFIGNNAGGCQAFDAWDIFEPNGWNNNYWSDYTGSDNNQDGYGDDPYEIDNWGDMGTGVPIDYAPLMGYTDSDNDSIPDMVDNCPGHHNTYQEDGDRDMIGNACDNCITNFNPDQADENQNGVGDVCENLCGDVNGSNSVNILDITFLIAYLYVEGPVPEHMQLTDVNGDCIINLLDITYLIAFLYLTGPMPDCPPEWPCR